MSSSLSNSSCPASTVPSLPAYAQGINISIILTTIGVVIASKFYQQNVLQNPYKSYPRLRVRPEKDAFTYYIMLLTACNILILELIGLERTPCIVTILAFTLSAMVACLSPARMLVYYFRVRISHLKREKDYDKYLELKQIWFRRLKLVWILFIVMIPFSILIYVLVDQRNLLFENVCYGCDLDMHGTIVPKIFLFFYSVPSILFLGLLFSIKDRPDVFAQIPEFRLQYLIPYPLSWIGYFIIAFDDYTGNIHSQFKFRGYWLISLSVMIVFIIGRPYQFYLASREGQLIDSDGTDALSRFWSYMKGNKRSRSKIMMTSVEYSFTEYVSHELGNTLFEDYLISEFSVELIRFYNAVVDFEKAFDIMSVTERNKAGFEIYRKFVAVNSPWEINISFSMRDKYISLFSSGNYDIENKTVFALIKDEVTKMLQLGPYLRFQTTQTYLNSIQNLNIESSLKRTSTIVVSTM